MTDLIYRLLLFLNSSKEENTNTVIARTLLKNIDKIQYMSIKQMSDICYTSPAGISRFCRKLGYSSLSEFKDNLAVAVKVGAMEYSSRKSPEAVSSRNDIIELMYNDITRELNVQKDSLDLIKLDNVLEKIFNTKKICLFGTRFSRLMIEDMQFKFAQLGKLMELAEDIQEQEQLASNLDKDTLVILISPSAKFSYYHKNIWEKIQESEANIIVMTTKKDNIYLERADEIIYFGEDVNDFKYVNTIRYSLAFLVEYMSNRYYQLYFMHT